MGEAKIPLFTFVDESGNTGHNLFDEAQPDFFTAALITPGDFDITFDARVRALANKMGCEALHGKELGLARLESIADALLDLVKAAKAGFFVSRVEKKYLLATKVFDSLFDSGENAAVAWHHYNLRPLRLLLAFKAAALIDMDTAKLFWRCLLEPNEEEAYKMLPSVCERLLQNLNRIPDARSRQILGEALNWARVHPESIQIHTDKKLSRHGHFPNLVAFANLMDGMDKYAKERRKTIARVTHDQQSEFEKTLNAWHEMFATASPEEIRWAGETYSLQKLPDSYFEVREDSLSVGIQVADIVLWLYSQFRKGRELPSNCTALLNYVFLNGWESDFSFSGIERSYLEKFGPVLSAPLTNEQKQAAERILNEAENARRESMAQYELDGLAPFLRATSGLTRHDPVSDE